MKKLNFNEFIVATSDHIQTAINGEVHVIGNGSRWGKIIFKNSEILSVVYGNHLGFDALPEIEKMIEIRMLCRPEAKRESRHQAASLITSEDFFSYFSSKYPKTIALCGRSVKSNTLDDVSFSRSSVKKKIMIIDDSAIARKMASIPLEKAGYSVVEANDGFDGLGKLKTSIPDLIILDLIMPGIDGYKVIDLLKKSKQYKNIPIILVTSKDSLMDKIKGKMSSTDAYITKPFQDGELLIKINECLERTGNFDDLILIS